MHSIGGSHVTANAGPPCCLPTQEAFSAATQHLRSKDWEELPVAVTWARMSGIREAAAVVPKMVPSASFLPGETCWRVFIDCSVGFGPLT